MEIVPFLQLPVSGWMLSTASHSSWALSTSVLTTATVRKGDPLRCRYAWVTVSPLLYLLALGLPALRYPLHMAVRMSFQQGKYDVTHPAQNPPEILHNSQR